MNYIKYIFFISVIFFSCQKQNKYTEVEKYIEQSIIRFERKMDDFAGAFNGHHRVINLKYDIRKIKDKYKESDNQELKIIEILQCIDKYNQEFDDKMICLEDLKAYAIPVQDDSMMILFDISPISVLPNIYQKDITSDLMKRVEISNHHPIKISISSPIYSEEYKNTYPNIQGSLGIYVFPNRGRDYSVVINNIQEVK